MSDTIAIVGVLNIDGSTNVSMAKSFVKKGFKVLPINYRYLAEIYGRKATETAILDLVREEKPKMTIFCKFNGFGSEIIGYSSEYSKTYYWFPDPIITIKTAPECYRHVTMADVASCTGKGVADHIRSVTGTKVHHITEGIDPAYYSPASFTITHDVVFIGTRSDERDLYLSAFQNAGFSVAAYGNGYTKEVVAANFCKACASGKILFAINNEHGINEYFSDRILRYGGCRSFVLHSYSPNMEKYFIPDIDVVYFRDVQSAVELVARYVNDDEARNAVAQSLYEKVLGNYTWDHIVDKMLKISGGDKCIKK